MRNFNPSRASKQIGDFGEHLVTYDFIRKGYEVALVDQVGADLICAKKEARYAVSVKARWFKNNSKESKMFAVQKSHLEKLKYFSGIFNLKPVFSLLVCLSDEKIMFLMTIKVKNIPKVFEEIKAGYSIKFSEKNRKELEKNPLISISMWEKETIGDDIFSQ
ncbi:MAG: hypothetical protein DRQ51_10625 [Gammaproteobacteria bacterium]|nr:MAG: hypothetical protein DRQ51_10625 [Gammaproteobacteria bacterium]